MNFIVLKKYSCVFDICHVDEEAVDIIFSVSDNSSTTFLYRPVLYPRGGQTTAAERERLSNNFCVIFKW